MARKGVSWFLRHIVSDFVAGSNFVQSASAIDETTWVRCVRSAHAYRIKRNFQAQFASISETSKGVRNFFASA
jgi:hypothetical protein